MPPPVIMRPSRVIPALALIAAVAVATGVALSTRSSPSIGSSGRSRHVTGSTIIRRRNLVETDTESGTISHADPQTVFNRVSGTITWLPRLGQVIKPGQALYRIDGEPVILMTGSTPAYRDLKVSDGEGADIEQLNRNLVALGFGTDGIVIDEEWQPATTAGVDMLQESLGEKETGSLSLGQIVFMPGDQLVATLDATVGSTGSGSGSPAAPANASTSVTDMTEFVGLTTTPTTPDTSTALYAPPTSPATSSRSTKSTKSRTAKWSKNTAGHGAAGASGSVARLTALLRAEAAQLKAATAALKAAKSSTGARRSSSSHHTSRPSFSISSNGGGSATAILQTSSTRLLVTVDLPASSQSEAVLGERVTVELPAGNTVGGKITAVSPVAQTSSSTSSGAATGGGSSGSGGGSSGSGGASSTVPVTITLQGHHRRAGLDQAAVSVNFAQAKARHVLSVPVTALTATSGGKYVVQEAAAPYTLLPVTTGLFAAGYVQISGPGIHGGVQVTDSQG